MAGASHLSSGIGELRDSGDGCLLSCPLAAFAGVDGASVSMYDEAENSWVNHPQIGSKIINPV